MTINIIHLGILNNKELELCIWKYVLSTINMYDIDCYSEFYYFIIHCNEVVQDRFIFVYVS